MRHPAKLALVLVLGSLALLAACSGGTEKETPANQPPAGAEARPPQGGEPPAGEAAPASARTLPIPTDGAVDPHATLPKGHPPLDAPTQPAPAAQPGDVIPPPPPGAGIGSAALAWTVPAGWKSEPPSSSMRRAQYRVPGPSGDGECVVFYFGPGQGGDPMSNAARWAGQFRQPDGRSPEDVMKTSVTRVGPIQVMQVEVTGTYDGGMTMTAAPATERPGYMLLGAVAAGPDANWYFKFTGPEATVQAQRGAFEKLLQSLKVGA